MGWPLWLVLFLSCREWCMGAGRGVRMRLSGHSRAGRKDDRKDGPIDLLLLVWSVCLSCVYTHTEPRCRSSRNTISWWYSSDSDSGGRARCGGDGIALYSVCREEWVGRWIGIEREYSKAISLIFNDEEQVYTTKRIMVVRCTPGSSYASAFFKHNIKFARLQTTFYTTFS